jgi:hypothetical protein
LGIRQPRLGRGFRDRSRCLARSISRAARDNEKGNERSEEKIDQRPCGAWPLDGLWKFSVGLDARGPEGIYGVQLTIRRTPGIPATSAVRAADHPAVRLAWRLVQGGAIAAALLGGILWQGGISHDSELDTTARPVEEYRFVPVRVHLLRASESPAVGTTLTKTDVERIFRKANGIWHAAGIHLWTESIVEEKPAKVEDPHAPILGSPTELRPLRPVDSRPEGMFHVYYVGRMGVNGIFMGRDAVFVQQSAQLRVVEGGIDEPLPRVTSHELGHGFGLSHRQERTNLMASGTTGTSLNEAEIKAARETCDGFDWVNSTSAFLDAADKLRSAKKDSEAESRYRAVGELPGESPLKERAKKALLALHPSQTDATKVGAATPRAP